jgi:CPA2 family monovalent cation:H+ antiporter-2
MRVGMGLSQIGEFSFIIASLGATLKVTSEFLYPVTVAVSAVTTLLTPYLIKLADPLSLKVSNAMPESLSRVFTNYTEWLRNIRPQEANVSVKKMIRRIVFQVLINFVVIIFVFGVSVFYSGNLFSLLSACGINHQVQRTVLWFAILIVSLPFFIAAYRKLQGLSMILAELAMKPNKTGRRYEKTKSIISEIIPVLSIVSMLFLVFLLSASILPGFQLLLLVLVIVSVIAWLLWKKFIRIHSKLQNALAATFDNNNKN